MKLLKVTPFVLLLVGAACGGGNKPEDAGGDAADATDAQMCPPTCPNADQPDVNGIDADGDGVDGVITDSIFVDSSVGDDANAGTRSAPVATIAHALSLAVTENKHAVLLAAGLYEAGATLVDGVSIHGSYTSVTWARLPLSGREPNSVISAASPVLVGTDVDGVRLSGLRVVAADATSPGGSSVAVHVSGSTLTIEDSRLVAGNGAMGVAGAMSTAMPTVGTNGANGLGPVTSVNVVPFETATSESPTPAPCGCGEVAEDRRTTTSRSPSLMDTAAPGSAPTVVAPSPTGIHGARPSYKIRNMAALARQVRPAPRVPRA